MARTAITVTEFGTAGIVLADEAVAAELTDGNSYPWAPGRHLYVANGDEAALTVTIPTPGTVGSQALAIADAVFTVPAGQDLILPALGPECRQSDGSVHVDFAGTTPSAVTVAVF